MKSLTRTAAWSVLVLVLYVASFGPAARLCTDGYVSFHIVDRSYRPMFDVAQHSQLAWDWLTRYVEFCTDHGATMARRED